MKLLSDIEKAFVKLRRKRVSKMIYNEYQGVVQNGIFKGLKLTHDTNTSAGVLGSKVLGFYENIVMENILSRAPFHNIINLGSADGYFAIGMLIKKLANRAICFEITESGRKSIEKNALLNHCSEKLNIFGKADSEFHKKIKDSGLDLTNSLIICDIEGGEFEYIQVDMFTQFKNTTWVIELHDRIQDLDCNLRKDLIKKIPSNLNYRIIKSQPINWTDNTRLETLSDNDRALLFSEGRKQIGEWIIIHP